MGKRNESYTGEGAARVKRRRTFEIPDTPPEKVFICSPYRGDTEENVENALQYCRMAVERGYFPHCPHVYFPRFMDDESKKERMLAIHLGKLWLTDCDEVWVFGSDITEGMQEEIDVAEKWNITIRRFDANFEEELDNE